MVIETDLSTPGPTSARAPGALWWSRWRVETVAQFRERVAEDAALAGITPIFSGAAGEADGHATFDPT